MQLSFDLFDNSLVAIDVEDINREPWEMTLSEFLSIDEWHAFPDPRAREENRGMYVIQKPDGSMWSGGWIGKYKNSEQAKRGFHKDQVYYKLLWGCDVPEKVLVDYPKLLKAKKRIDEYMQTVHIGSGDYVRVERPEGVKFFHIMDFPMFCRVGARSFVISGGLCGARNPEDEIFNSVEIAAIALYRSLRNAGMSPDYRPHLIQDEYRELYFDYGERKVRFALPAQIDQEGNATLFTYHEGTASYSYSFGQPAIEYEDDGETKVILLNPSQLVAYQDDNQNWIHA